MLFDDKIFLGTSTQPKYVALKYGNRHGLLTGATSTGKTATLQVMAEGFSAAGVPVFAANIKGDLSGIAKMDQAQSWQTKFKDDIFHVIFWGLFSKQGHSIRAIMPEIGALLLSHMLELNDIQEGVLNIAFKLADDEGLLLLDLRDLCALLINMQERAKEISSHYGNGSIGAIQRSLLVLEQRGAENFFGERALAIADLMRTDRDGRSFISVLAADDLMQSPPLCATFLLWLLSELFKELPEVGDVDKPKLAFVFDEAYLLFDDVLKALIDKVEQVVRLVRLKGVGVYFVTQNPVDIPESILLQLGNRMQHALRAYTPCEQKAVRISAEIFRSNSAFSTEEVITQLGIGEALVSVLESKGVPSVVGCIMIRPPSAQVGPITPDERKAVMANLPVGGLYNTTIDRDSAFEALTRKARDKQLAEERQKLEDQERKSADLICQKDRPARQSSRQTPAEAAMNSLAHTVANRLGSALVRDILGSLKRGG